MINQITWRTKSITTWAMDRWMKNAAEGLKLVRSNLSFLFYKDFVLIRSRTVYSQYGHHSSWYQTRELSPSSTVAYCWRLTLVSRAKPTWWWPQWPGRPFGWRPKWPLLLHTPPQSTHTLGDNARECLTRKLPYYNCRYIRKGEIVLPYSIKSQ